MADWPVIFTNPKTGKEQTIYITSDTQPTQAQIEEVVSQVQSHLAPREPNVRDLSPEYAQSMQDNLGGLYHDSMRPRPPRGGTVADSEGAVSPDYPTSSQLRRPMNPFVFYDTQTGEPTAPVWWVPPHLYEALHGLPSNGKGINFYDEKQGRDVGIRAATPDDINKMRRDFSDYYDEGGDDRLFNLYGTKDFISDFAPEATVTAASGGLSGAATSGAMAEAAEQGAKWAGNKALRFLVPMAAGGAASNLASSGVRLANRAYDPEQENVREFIGRTYRQRHPIETTAIEQAPNFLLGNPTKFAGTLGARAINAGISGITEAGRQQLMGEEENPLLIGEHALFGAAAPAEGGAMGFAERGGANAVKAGSRGAAFLREMGTPIDYSNSELTRGLSDSEMGREFTRLSELGAGPIAPNRGGVPVTSSLPTMEGGPVPGRGISALDLSPPKQTYEVPNPGAGGPLATPEAYTREVPKVVETKTTNAKGETLTGKRRVVENPTILGNAIRTQNRKLKGQQMFPGETPGTNQRPLLEPPTNSLLTTPIPPRSPQFEFTDQNTVPVGSTPEYTVHSASDLPFDRTERQLPLPGEEGFDFPGPQARLTNLVDLDETGNIRTEPQTNDLSQRFGGLIDDETPPVPTPKPRVQKTKNNVLPGDTNLLAMAGGFSMKKVVGPDGQTYWIPDTSPQVQAPQSQPITNSLLPEDPTEQLAQHMANRYVQGVDDFAPEREGFSPLADVVTAMRRQNGSRPDVVAAGNRAHEISKERNKQRTENLVPWVAEQAITNLDSPDKNRATQYLAHAYNETVRNPENRETYGGTYDNGFGLHDHNFSKPVIDTITKYGGAFKPGTQPGDTTNILAAMAHRPEWNDWGFQPENIGLVDDGKLPGGLLGLERPGDFLTGNLDPNRIYAMTPWSGYDNAASQIAGSREGDMIEGITALYRPNSFRAGLQYPVTVHPDTGVVGAHQYFQIPGREGTDLYSLAADIAEQVGKPEVAEAFRNGETYYGEDGVSATTPDMFIEQYGEPFLGKRAHTAFNAVTSGIREYNPSVPSHEIHVSSHRLEPYEGPIERPGLVPLRRMAEEGRQRQAQAMQNVADAIAEFRQKYGIASSIAGPMVDPVIGSKLLYNSFDSMLQGMKAGVFKSAADVHEYLTGIFGKDVADRDAESMWETATSGGMGGGKNQARAATSSLGTATGSPNDPNFQRYRTQVVRQRGRKLFPQDANAINNSNAVSKLSQDYMENKENYRTVKPEWNAERAARLAKAATFVYDPRLTPKQRTDGWVNAMGGDYQRIKANLKNTYTDKEMSELYGYIMQSKGASWNNIRAQGALTKLLAGDYLQPNESNLLADVFGENFRDVSDPNSGLFQRVMLTNSLMKAIRFSADRSAVLNNAAPLTSRGLWDGQTLAGLKRMGAVSFGKLENQVQAFEDLTKELRQYPDVANGLMESLGLDLRGMSIDMGPNAPQHQEVFEAAQVIDDFAEALRNNQIPVYGKIPQRVLGTDAVQLPPGLAPVMRMLSWIPGEVGASERAMTGYINYMKVARTQQLFNALRTAGVDPNTDEGLKAFKQAVDVVQHMAGQGNYGKLGGVVDLDDYTAKGFRDLMNVLFNAPRFMVSTMKTTGLPGVVYWGSTIKNAPQQVRAEYVKNMASSLAVGTALLVGYAARGGRVNVDPDNADYGTITVGNTRYQPFGRNQPVARMYAQIMKRVATNNWMNIRREIPWLGHMLDKIPTYPKGPTKFGASGIGEILPTGFVNRMNPIWSTMLQIGRGHGYGVDPRTAGHKSEGLPKLTNEEEDLLKQLMPLVWKDALEAYENGSGTNAEKGMDTAAAYGASFIGGRVETPSRIQAARRKKDRHVTVGGVRLLAP